MALAAQFQAQGLRHEAAANILWCTLCTVTTNQASDGPQENAGGSAGACSGAEGDGVELCIVESTQAGILQHCATRDHLLRYEAHCADGLLGWCPVAIDGQRMLLDHHCVYPHRVFGQGAVLMDETIAGGMLLAEDVCGGVKLWPRHHYRLVELVLPSSDSFTREVSPGVEVFYEPAATVRQVKKGWSRENDVRTNGVQRLPSFFGEGNGVSSMRARSGDLATVLQMANESMQGEAHRRRSRRDTFARLNL